MRKTVLSRSALAAALTLGLSFGAVHAANDTDVHAFESDGVLHFKPVFVASGYAVKISGPGDFHREMLFTDEDTLGVTLKSLGQLLDGTYKYEITPITGFQKRSADRANVIGDVRSVEPTSGVFSVVEGRLLAPDAALVEPSGVVDDRDGGSLAKDQVILDDLIVDGSICAGMDCVNGESFGFDTIRLKENNLRIKFDDTSASASFPNVDWQITANDSANGGANKFSIDDITNSKTPFTVEANAPSHSLYVDDGGRLGLGTNTPVVDVHVKSGNTPTMRLEQDGSSGFAAQTWDVAGNEANFFIRDVTTGSKLPFRIRPGAPTSSIDIAANGNIGMGTSSPQTKLHISGVAANTLRIETTGGSTPNAWDFGDAGNGTFKISEISSGQTDLRLSAQGLFRLAPVDSPPTVSIGLGSIYNDTSGALCWYDGSAWLKIVGSGTCQ